MTIQREIAHRLLDELLDHGQSCGSAEMRSAKRHFLQAKREFLLGALSLVDHALAQREPAADDQAATKSKTIVVED